MSGESQTRRRKDRKKRVKETEKIEHFLKKFGHEEEDEDEEENVSSSAKEDTEDGSEDKRRTRKIGHDDHGHGNSTSKVGFISIAVFLLLLGGLVVLTTLIFLELKDSSKDLGTTPIAESRYASILGDLVDENKEHDGEEEEEEGGGRGHESVVRHEEEEEEEEVEEDEGYGGEEREQAADVYLPEERRRESGEEEIDVLHKEVTWSEGEEEEEPPKDEERVIESSETHEWSSPEDVHLQEEEVEHEIQPEKGGGVNEIVAEEAENVVMESEIEGEGYVLEEQDNADDKETVIEVIGSGTEEENQRSNEDLSNGYEHEDITNEYDYEFHNELDEADKMIEKSPAEAKKLFETILESHATSPRATYGKAKCLDKLSEEKRSNAILEESIYLYRDVVGLPNVKDELFRLAAERCVERMTFRGFIAKATRVQQLLIKRFPNVAKYRNELAVSYLLLGQNKAAKQVLEEVLRLFPNDGFAKVHYGFILKTDDENYTAAIRYLQEGIETGEPGTIDGRFFFQLGDALGREGRPQEALKIYESGAARGLFLSAYQRSLYNVDKLTGRPWWTPEQTTYKNHMDKLETKWKLIRDEGLSLLDESSKGFVPETEGLRDTGVWKQFELYARGRKIEENCAKAPKTCKLIEEIPDAANCNRGQVKFSIMHPGTHVWSHTGPTNCRLRAHLGLVVPPGVRIRVVNDTRQWIEGRFIIFDDSFEHEVWHEGDSYRLVLIVDFWHPELTPYQKRTLSPI